MASIFCTGVTRRSRLRGGARSSRPTGCHSKKQPRVSVTRVINISLLLIGVVAAWLAIALRSLAPAVVAILLMLLVATSAAGSSQIAAQCERLKGQAVTVRIWGDAPKDFGGADVFVRRVWALGAGLHFQVVTGSGARSAHIKVAQPRRWLVDDNSLRIADAKYVQVSGATARRIAGPPAIEFLLHPSERS